MKGLIFLMIVCSLFINFTVDEFGWLILYKMEFPSPTEIFRLGEVFMIIIWVLLILAHAATIGLLFLTHKKYFSDLLFCVPLLFLIFFLFFNLFTLPLLIPFVIIWLVALAKNFKWKITYKVAIKPLVFALIVLSLIMGINLAGGLFFLIFAEFLQPFYALKAGNYNLWEGIIWILLVISHLTLISMAFLTKKQYFNKLLIWVPAVYIGLFSAFNYLAFYLLIPFLVVLVVALPGKVSSKSVVLPQIAA